MPEIDPTVSSASQPAADDPASQRHDTPPPAHDAASQAPPAEAASPYEAGLRDESRNESPNERPGGADRQAALRALRNLEATEARLARNAKREVEEARGKLVQELLPVLDNLDRTIEAAYSHGSDRGQLAMLEGVRMVRQQFESVLRGFGVERVDAIGQRFDPGLHEAIGVTPVSDPRRHGTVVHQVEPGYRFAGRLLRPAKVNVGKFVAPAPAARHPFWR